MPPKKLFNDILKDTLHTHTESNTFHIKDTLLSLLAPSNCSFFIINQWGKREWRNCQILVHISLNVHCIINGDYIEIYWQENFNINFSCCENFYEIAKRSYTIDIVDILHCKNMSHGLKRKKHLCPLGCV